MAEAIKKRGKASSRFFPDEEYEVRRERVRAVMAERKLDAVLVASPENVYYLTGLDHMGYFAYELLILPREGQPILITRAMEKATVRDQVPDVEHVGYSDGMPPLPPAEHPDRDLQLAPDQQGGSAGLQPWSMSFGVPTREVGTSRQHASVSVQVTCDTLERAGLGAARLGIEKNSSFLPFQVAEGIVGGLPEVTWEDASGLVADVRIIQSSRELACTREAACLSDSMMLAAIAAAGRGVNKRDVMAAIYDAMFRRGGTYPGFVPLVRSTHTIEHEHGTWEDTKLVSKDLLFLEMAGCIRRYHAPMGRLVFIDKAPTSAYRMQEVCARAIEAAANRIGPGVQAGEVYAVWQSVLNDAGLGRYTRHHCGYSVGIGFPPSWSGSGVPVGLRADSRMELRPGMVFHLMSWLLRTGKGDFFLSDTAVVTESGCDVLTNASREVVVRK